VDRRAVDLGGREALQALRRSQPSDPAQPAAGYVDLAQEHPSLEGTDQDEGGASVGELPGRDALPRAEQVPPVDEQGTDLGVEVGFSDTPLGADPGVALLRGDPPGVALRPLGHLAGPARVAARGHPVLPLARGLESGTGPGDPLAGGDPPLEVAGPRHLAGSDQSAGRDQRPARRRDVAGRQVRLDLAERLMRGALASLVDGRVPWLGHVSRPVSAGGRRLSPGGGALGQGHWFEYS
jgi:hypothetical protein